MIWNILIAILAAVLTLLGYFMWTFTHWARLGVTGPVPTIPYGNRTPNSSHQLSQLIQYYYHQFKHSGLPFFGMYLSLQPVAVITDLEMAKDVLIKDFPSFQHRGLYTNEKDDPLSATLFAVGGERWRRWRTKLTPTFSSGKMKFMFPTVLGVANKFEIFLSRVMRDSEELEIKDVLARFTTDVIGACAFGIECNSLEDPDAEFRRMGRLINEHPRHSALSKILISAFPRISLALGIKLVREDVSTFFLDVVRQTVQKREAENIRRNDFMDLLIELKNEDTDPMTIEEMASQVFIFFVAGLDTSSTAMMFALFELAKNLDIQNKVRNEIKSVLSQHDGNFTYEAMMEMTFVDQVLNEAMRKYPPIPLIVRKSTEDYPVPGTDIILPRGTLTFIPTYSIHNDPELFPEPETFIPDRFTADEKLNRERMQFLPFSEGPRNCIGARFGMMQARVGLVMLLMNYEFTTSPRTQEPLEFDVRSFVLMPYNGMWLKLRKL